MQQNNFKELLLVDREALQISPSDITFSLNKSVQEFQIKNLTLHQYQIRILSPNPNIILFNHEYVLIKPCETITIQTRIKIYSNSTFSSLRQNRKIIIKAYNVDFFNEKNSQYTSWSKISKQYIIGYIYVIQSFSSYQINIKYHDDDNIILKLKYSASINTLIENTLVLQKINMNPQLEEEFQEMEKNQLIEEIFQKFGNTQTFFVAQKLLIFQYLQENKQVNIFQNEILITTFQNRTLFFYLFKPHILLQQIPKYEIEPSSPKNIKKRKPIKTAILRKSYDDRQSVKIIDDTQQDEILEELIDTRRIKRTLSLQQEIGSLKLQEQRKQQEIFTKNDDEEFHLFNFLTRKQRLEERIEKDQQTQQIPVYFLRQISQKQLEKEQSSIQINEITQINNYGVAIQAILFDDNEYLVTVLQNYIIKIWNPKKNLELGQFREHQDKKKGKILFMKVWQYKDPNADENYQFAEKDPQKEQNIKYPSNDDKHRIVTVGEDSIIRIFNLEEMKLEYQFDSRLDIVSCMTFLPFRGLFAIGGKPNNTIFGQRRKYNSIRFFRMDSLQEKPKYKIFSFYDDEHLKCLVYSDNQGKQDHIRIDNTFGLIITRQNYKGEEYLNGTKLLFLYFDRENKCTVLFSFECYQLNLKGIQEIYFQKSTGMFILIENTNLIDIQGNRIGQINKKIIKLNLKQLSTNQGIQNGMECNIIEQNEQTIKIIQDIKILQEHNIIIIFDSEYLIAKRLNNLEIVDKYKVDNQFNKLIGFNNNMIVIGNNELINILQIL